MPLTICRGTKCSMQDSDAAIHQHIFILLCQIRIPFYALFRLHSAKTDKLHILLARSIECRCTRLACYVDEKILYVFVSLCSCVLQRSKWLSKRSHQ